MTSIAREWNLTIVMLAYLILYFVVVNLQPTMAEYMAAIGVMMGVVIWIRYQQRYKKAVREKDQYIRKDYRRIVIWMIFYLAAIAGIYFAYFSK